VLESIRRLWEREFVQNVLHTLSSKGVLIAIGLISNVIITRGLGPDGKGVYGLVITIITVGLQFGHLGLHSSNTYFVAKDRSIWGRLFANSIIIALTSGLLISGIMIAINELAPQVFQLDSSFQFNLIILIGTPLALMSLLFKNLLIGVQHIKQNNYFEMLSRSLYVIAIVTLYLTGVLDVVTVLIAYMFEHLMVILLEGRYMVRKADRPMRPSLSLFNRNLRYGLRAYAAIFLAFLVIRSDVLLLNYYLEDEQVGYYFTSVQLIDQFKMLGAVVAGVLMPRLASTDSIKEKFRLNLKVLRTMTLVLSVAGLVVILLAKPIILLLFGKAFLPSVASLRILVVAMIFLSLETVLGQFLAAIGMPMRLVYFWLLCFLINLVLNIMWIPIYGEIGAAYASVISYLSIFILVFIYSWNKVKAS